MRRRIFLLAAPMLFLVWFFVCGQQAQALGQPDHLWHFDECNGAVLHDSVGTENLNSGANWIVGKWQCGLNQLWQSQYQITKVFNAPLPDGELSLSFYWRNSLWPSQTRNHIFLRKANGSVAAGFVLTDAGNAVYGDGWSVGGMVPMPADGNWHLITISYGREGVAYYLDGIRKWFWTGDYSITQDIASLEIKGENGSADMDELALWQRALTFEEAIEIYNNVAPLEPFTPLPPPEEPKLLHLWHFDEAIGSTAADSVGQTVLSPILSWPTGRFGSGIYQSWPTQYKISQSLDRPISSHDLSIGFWWQNISAPNEGRGSLKLQNSLGVNVLGFRFSSVSSGYYLNGDMYSWPTPIFNDGRWHHVVVTYDAHEFELVVYIDGVEQVRHKRVWLNLPLTKILVNGENFSYYLDDIAVWQGVLNKDKIKDDYDSGQPQQETAINPVILVPGILGSWEINGQWTLDPILHSYDNLIEALIAAGYKEDTATENKPTLFTFPYDWRQDNNLTAQLLKEKIQQVRDETGSKKVDIIAHSMGGLVTRSYVQGAEYRNDIDQVIFLGTPHLGSLESYLKYEGGYFTGELSWLKEYYFQTEASLNGYNSLVDYIKEKVPSVKQLLPVFDYLKDWQADNWQLRDYPVNYPINSYLSGLNVEESVNTLKQRVKVTNIVSDLGSDSTLGAIKVVPDPDNTDNQWIDGYPENLSSDKSGLEFVGGDKTVPLTSADSLSGVPVIRSTSADHKNLPTIMQKEIIEVLTGKTPADYFGNKITSTIKRWLFFRVYSPVDFVVVAPDGRRVGKDFATNGIINEIPEAFYSGFGNHTEFVMIPEPQDGEYKVAVQGVEAGGQYALVNSYIDDTAEYEAVYNGAVAVNEQREFVVDYQAQNAEPIGQFEPVDTVPPSVAINQPVAGQTFLRSDNLLIDFSANDDFSGLATTTLSVDGQLLSTSTVDLFEYGLGEHRLTLVAFDQSGNQAEIDLIFKVVVDFDSAVSDVEEITARGWLSSKSYKAVLTNALRLIKTEDRFLLREKTLTEQMLKKTQADSKLNAKQKQRVVEQYNKTLIVVKQNRLKALNRNLDLFVAILDRVKKQGRINQAGYDIIINDINYLRVNL